MLNDGSLSHNQRKRTDVFWEYKHLIHTEVGSPAEKVHRNPTHWKTEVRDIWQMLANWVQSWSTWHFFHIPANGHLILKTKSLHCWGDKSNLKSAIRKFNQCLHGSSVTGSRRKHFIFKNKQWNGSKKRVCVYSQPKNSIHFPQKLVSKYKICVGFTVTRVPSFVTHGNSDNTTTTRSLQISGAWRHFSWSCSQNITSSLNLATLQPSPCRCCDGVKISVFLVDVVWVGISLPPPSPVPPPSHLTNNTDFTKS